MVILMAWGILTEPEFSVDVDADAVADAELMLSWEIRLLCGLLKKVNDDEWTNEWKTLEVRAISAAKVDVDADSDADADAVPDADAAAELSNN